MLVLARRITIENAPRIIERELPIEGRVLVKPGQQVRPETVIGVCWCASGFKTFNLAKLLKVPASRSKDLILHPIGSRIYKGAVIAKRKQFGGLRELEFISPIDGILHDFSEQKGILTIQYAPKEFKLVAGVGGVVDRVIPNRGVNIGAVVSEVKGVLAAGSDRDGLIKIISNPDIAIASPAITGTCEGKIVVGGALLSKEIIYKCLALKVRGIVCGGIHWRDFNEMVTIARGRSEDIGTTVFITEGFGYQPMNKQIFEFLTRYENRFAMILSDLVRLVIPDLGKTVDGKEYIEDKNVKLAPIAVGEQVRVIAPPRLDLFGKIAEAELVEDRVESGLRTQTCLVEFEQKTERVPVRNVEIIKTS
ncbi:hypothetical protein KJ596_00930 [Patescibacteria group bacterium]|nr:hypothetical protein [Patescibacteria group bacterium]MBU1868810.1 hypothetical protein [Patescibacteria group bacterium]